ncbi:hypothetical protein VTI74DRAFT_6952 [Chaetomium olivicolor]
MVPLRPGLIANLRETRKVDVVVSAAGWYSILWYMLSLLSTKAGICLLHLRLLSFRHSRYAIRAAFASSPPTTASCRA